MNNWNMGRFAGKLLAARTYDAYNRLLADNYNGATVAHIMCRTQLNVDYDGGLYDCEVNHVLGLPLDGRPTCATSSMRRCQGVASRRAPSAIRAPRAVVPAAVAACSRSTRSDQDLR